MSNATWKKIDVLDIVYCTSPLFAFEFDGVAYPKAYIVTHGDEAMMGSAISWAGDKRQVVTTANEGFTFRIAKAAPTSFNSGKLSFWMCIFEKDGIEPFAAGINAELLCLLIAQSTLVEGRLLDNHVFFVRRDGQLGVLHDKMPAYQEFEAACSVRDTMSRNKTSKWQPGNMYATVTLCDVMFADMVMPLRFHDSVWDNRVHHGTVDTYILDFDANPTKVFGHADKTSAYVCGIFLERGDQDDQLDEFESTFASAMFQSTKDPHKKCPSRHCAGPAPFAERVNKPNITDALEKICALALDAFVATNAYRHNWADLLAYHLALCECSPERGLVALERLDAALPASNNNGRQWLRNREREAFVVRSDDERKFATELEMVRHIIRKAQNHYASRV